MSVIKRKLTNPEGRDESSGDEDEEKEKRSVKSGRSLSEKKVLFLEFLHE
jgi:hypothetical protein